MVYSLTSTKHCLNQLTSHSDVQEVQSAEPTCGKICTWRKCYLSDWSLFSVTQCNSLPFNFTLRHSMSLCVTQCHLPARWAAGDTCVRLFEDGGPPGELVQVGSADLAKEWGHHMQSWNLKQRVFLHIMWKRIKRTYLFFVSLYTSAKFFFPNLFFSHLIKKKITLLILMHLCCFIVSEDCRDLRVFRL